MSNCFCLSVSRAWQQRAGGLYIARQRVAYWFRGDSHRKGKLKKFAPSRPSALPPDAIWRLIHMYVGAMIKAAPGARSSSFVIAPEKWFPGAIDCLRAPPQSLNYFHTRGCTGFDRFRGRLAGLLPECVCQLQFLPLSIQRKKAKRQNLVIDCCRTLCKTSSLVDIWNFNYRVHKVDVSNHLFVLC